MGIADDLLSDIVNPAIIRTEPDTPVEVTPQDVEREGYAWAKDAFWAYHHLGEKMTRQKAGTSARWAQWSAAKKDTNYFLMQILPKAMGLLERSRDKNADADMVDREEKKEIAKLQKLLKDAIKEAIGLG